MKINMLFIMATLIFISACTQSQEQVTPVANSNPNFIAKVADVPANSIKEFTYKGESAILVNFNGDYKAYVNKCTHKQLQFDENSLKDDRIVCPFHGNAFAPDTGEYVGNVNGQNFGLAGLTMIELNIQDGSISFV